MSSEPDFWDRVFAWTIGAAMVIALLLSLTLLILTVAVVVAL